MITILRKQRIIRPKMKARRKGTSLLKQKEAKLPLTKEYKRAKQREIQEKTEEEKQISIYRTIISLSLTMTLKKLNTSAVTFPFKH
ncbi:hypothetical protein CHS0354_035932, partial [Potamilus streckersoni]